MKSVLDLLLHDLLLPPSSSSSSSSSSPPSPSSPSSPVLSPSPSYTTILQAATLIEELWSATKDEPTKTSLLHSFFSPFLLSRLIPVYESQWRVVFYAVLEFFRRNSKTKESEKIQKSDLEMVRSGNFVKETLRLYAPVKTVKRAEKVKEKEENRRKGEERELGGVQTYKIAEHMRSVEIFGESALEFMPERKYSKKQEEEMKKVFGMGELKCIAGLEFVQKLCSAIILKIIQEFKREDEVKWENLQSPLENARGKYEDLLILKI